MSINSNNLNERYKHPAGKSGYESYYESLKTNSISYFKFMLIAFSILFSLISITIGVVTIMKYNPILGILAISFVFFNVLYFLQKE
jgi:hypothetical protein